MHSMVGKVSSRHLKISNSDNQFNSTVKGIANKAIFYSCISFVVVFILVVAVLDELGEGAPHCGGSSCVGSAVEVEEDGAKRTLLTKFI